LKVSSRGNSGNGSQAVRIRYNNDSSSIYNVGLMRGAGSGTVGQTSPATTTYSLNYSLSNGSAESANAFSVGEFFIPRYSGTSFNKQSLCISAGENNATLSYMGISANIWTSIAAITSLVITPEVASTFNTYSSFSLYGIKNS
jgi:hypothetical protein